MLGLSEPAYRLRDVLFIPVLFLLHLLFTISSLFLRIYEAITDRPDTSTPVKTTSPPRHVALVLAGSASGNKARPAAGRGAVIESVRRVVNLAGSEGVTELSVWDANGV